MNDGSGSGRISRESAVGPFIAAATIVSSRPCAVLICVLRAVSVLAKQVGQSGCARGQQHADAARAKAERRCDLAMVRPAPRARATRADARAASADGTAGRRRRAAPRRERSRPVRGRVAGLVLVRAPVVDDQIARDAEHIGAQLVAIVCWQRRAQQPQERLLHDVVGVLGVPSDRSDVAAQRRRRARVERVKGASSSSAARAPAVSAAAFMPSSAMA